MSRFGDDALGPALRGAALSELGRYRDGLPALEEAAARDPNLGIVWHEAGYAAYRLGEYSRALMALDRAFALEPHSGTPSPQGKVLRQAGRYSRRRGVLSKAPPRRQSSPNNAPRRSARSA